MLAQKSFKLSLQKIVMLRKLYVYCKLFEENWLAISSRNIMISINPSRLVDWLRVPTPMRENRVRA